LASSLQSLSPSSLCTATSRIRAHAQLLDAQPRNFKTQHLPDLDPTPLDPNHELNPQTLNLKHAAEADKELLDTRAGEALERARAEFKEGLERDGGVDSSATAEERADRFFSEMEDAATEYAWTREMARLQNVRGFGIWGLGRWRGYRM
jgi:hypothetical protein